MAIPFLSDIKLNGNQIKELVVDHKSGSQPTAGYHGQLIFRTDQNKVYVNTSTTANSPSWESIAGDIKEVVAGSGLTGGGIIDDVTLNIGNGDGITVSADKISVTVDDSTIELSASDNSGAVRIKDSGVVSDKIADGAVGTIKIADNAVTLAKLAHQTNNTVFKVNGSGVPTAGTIDTANITDDAINGDKIADDAINSEHITDGSVDNVHLANSSININGTDISLGGTVTTPNTDTLQTIAAATDDDDKFVTFVETTTGAQTGMSGANFKFNPGLNGGTLYVPNIIVSGDSTISNETVKVVEDNTLQFEGAAGSNADTELNLTTATLSGGDKTVTLKNESGTVALTSDIGDATITITAGAGLVTGGSFTTNEGTNQEITIDHEDTSSQASVNNSGLNVIQDVTLDTYGHVTGLASVDLQSSIDGRVTAREFSGVIGNGSAVSYNIDDSGASAPHINHGLGSDSTQFMVQLVEVSTGATVNADVVRASNGRVTCSFGSAPTTNNIRVLITKID